MYRSRLLGRSCQWLIIGACSALLSSCAPTPERLEDVQPAPIITARGVKVAPPDSFSLSTPPSAPAKSRDATAAAPLDNYATSGWRDGLGVRPNRPAQAGESSVDDADKYELRPSRDSDQQGMASWYGEQFHGRKTASGERFDSMGFTAAHRNLPFGSRVCVRSKVTGKTVVVRINDRGPFAPGRVIDLSKAAAQELGMIGLGIKPVELWQLDEDEDECPLRLATSGRKQHSSASAAPRKVQMAARTRRAAVARRPARK